MRYPLYSLNGQTDESTDALRLIMYLRELERQARIATRAFGRAWRAAMTEHHDVEDVWADLQSCMFAAIIIERILKPKRGSIWAKAGLDKEAAAEHAERRAARLLELLGAPDDLSALQVSTVRHPLEHVDERLDEVALRGYATVSDWYISDTCVVAQTPPPETGYAEASTGLRVFVPSNGLLLFGRQVLDMYALDAVLLSIRDAVPGVLDELMVPDRNLFGSAQLTVYDQDRQSRFRRFLEIRAAAGDPIDLTGLVWAESPPSVPRWSQQHAGSHDADGTPAQPPSD